jgi:hypothetical protein
MHQTRPIARPRRSRRSPLVTGCTFALLILVLLALAGYGLARAGVAAPLILQRAWPANLPDTPTAGEAVLLPEPQNPSPSAGAGSPQATALSTAAPVPLLSPSALSTAPTRPPASPTATRSRLPAVASDLLYLSQNRLMRWDRLVGSTQLLVENVADYTASHGGTAVALLRPRKMTANGSERFDLEILNLQTLQTSPLLAEIPRPLALALSPDGDWLAYILPTENGAIYLRKIEAQAEARSLGNCRADPDRPCSSLAWSPDSKQLAWSDSQGVWLASREEHLAANPPETPARLVHSNRVQVSDPQGKSSQIEVSFDSPAWSPAGRFILLEVRPLASSVSWQGVVDTSSGRLSQAQDSFRYAPSEADAIWLPDGSLLVIHASDPQRQAPPFVHVWAVMPTSPDLLESRRQYNLYSDAFPFSESARKSIPAHSLDWPGMLDAHRLGLGVRLFGLDIAPILFRLDLPTGVLYKLSDLPADIAQVLWSPDGAGALALGPRGQAFYMPFSNRSSDGGPLGGGELSDLRPALGGDAHRFTWLPPVVRLP